MNASRFVLSLHDVSHRHQAAVESILSRLREWNLPPAVLLVVPDFHGEWPLEKHPEFLDRLSSWRIQGHELCLHGCFHTELPEDAATATGVGGAFRRRFLTAGEGEFLSLAGERLERRLDDGLAHWGAAGLGAVPDGFVPPAWLHSTALPEALWKRGFRWTENHAGFLTPGGAVKAPVITWASRDPLRRIGSRLFAPAALRAWRSEPLLRIAIHPHDLEHPSLVRSIRETLAKVRDHRLPWTDCVRDCIIEA